ncbi:MAG: hypothetical protein A3I00_03455 [Betaproteobacteria bacterium RIFCSPLOWO2_02_FULL_64_12]|nr:MAG: hypothetical protein A3I00_03455 [Betaproteobacteria bacterium RIFCSPLOWO2_02_FULL_64_12]
MREPMSEKSRRNGPHANRVTIICGSDWSEGVSGNPVLSELPLIPPSRAPARAWRLARRVLLALCVPVIASCVSLQAPPGDRQSEPAVG